MVHKYLGPTDRQYSGLPTNLDFSTVSVDNVPFSNQSLKKYVVFLQMFDIE